MRWMNVFAVGAIVNLGFLAGFAFPASAQSVTAFEGARLIVGDRRVIENATLVVDGAKIAQAGGVADVRVPAGATRVNLAGKTVMPMLIDTHVHLSPTRDALIRDLRMRAYYGAIIDEAHKRGLRVTAHIFDLEDAKGLIRAGVDVFAHGVRDRDIDDELVAMFAHLW